MELFDVVKTVNFVIGIVFFVCYSYQFLYIPLVHMKRDRPHTTAKLHSFAVLICARNEEAVIADVKGHAHLLYWARNEVHLV